MTWNWDKCVAIEAKQSRLAIVRDIKNIGKIIDARMAALEARVAEIEVLMGVAKSSNSVRCRIPSPQLRSS
jgi:hypothetical protein